MSEQTPDQTPDQTVDLVVIGLGPGGEALASTAAGAGLSVLAVDKHLVGGECPYYGCIPSKMMVRASDALAEAGRVAELAGDVTVTASWAPVAERVATQATDHWDDTVAVERLQKAGATVVHGVGRLAGPGRVSVEAPDGSLTTYAAGKVVLNPGTRPARLPIPGLEGTPYWTNREALQATELPGSLIVIGGGPIGCELTQVFTRFGVRVSLIEVGERIMGPVEPEAAAIVADVFAHEGVRVLTGAEITSVSYADGTFTVALGDGEHLTADKLLVAAGRTPNLDDLGLDTVGLDPTARTLPVGETLRVEGGDGWLWAIGDVTGKGAFTHVSMYQSAIAADDVLDRDPQPADYHALPHVTFTDPEVGGVGLTEAQARKAGLSVRVGSTPLEQSSRGFTHGPGATGLIKVVEDADRGVLVGATAVGPAGGEILGLLALAVHAEVPVATMRTMIYAYPTFHRAIETALDELGED